MIYFDAAALMKLAHPEEESHALDIWLTERIGFPRFSSKLVEVEVPRALRRSAPTALGQVSVVLATIHRLDIDAAVRATAATFQDSLLRSLDAIHLATALQLSDSISAFVTYDKRLLAAAEGQGLPVASPGA